MRGAEGRKSTAGAPERWSEEVVLMIGWVCVCFIPGRCGVEDEFGMSFSFGVGLGLGSEGSLGLVSSTGCLSYF